VTRKKKEKSGDNKIVDNKIRIYTYNQKTMNLPHLKVYFREEGGIERG
jgi:hypothetical protein